MRCQSRTVRCAHARPDPGRVLPPGLCGVRTRRVAVLPHVLGAHRPAEPSRVPLVRPAAGAIGRSLLGLSAGARDVVAGGLSVRGSRSERAHAAQVRRPSRHCGGRRPVDGVGAGQVAACRGGSRIARHHLGAARHRPAPSAWLRPGRGPGSGRGKHDGRVGEEIAGAHDRNASPGPASGPSAPASAPRRIHGPPSRPSEGPARRRRADERGHCRVLRARPSPRRSTRGRRPRGRALARSRGSGPLL
jgi:hypothetical protein